MIKLYLTVTYYTNPETFRGITTKIPLENNARKYYKVMKYGEYIAIDTIIEEEYGEPRVIGTHYETSNLNHIYNWFESKGMQLHILDERISGKPVVELGMHTNCDVMISKILYDIEFSELPVLKKDMEYIGSKIEIAKENLHFKGIVPDFDLSYYSNVQERLFDRICELI